MKRPIRTFDDIQRRKMIRTLWAPGSRQLAFDFVEPPRGIRWPEVKKEKAVRSEPPQAKRKEKYAR
jgi:hypothetical protein